MSSCFHNEPEEVGGCLTGAAKILVLAGFSTLKSRRNGTPGKKSLFSTGPSAMLEVSI